VIWPCLINVNTHTGKAVIEFEKKTEGLWETYGVDEQDHGLILPNSEEIDKYHHMKIVSVTQLTHDTRNYVLKFEERVCMWVPLGHDVRLRAVIQGVDTAKQYTPIPPSLPHSPAPRHWHHDYICVMVKMYHHGALTPWLFDKKENDVIELGGISGKFDINKLTHVTELYMIAAGSGISPMIKLIVWGLQEKQQV
jgi:cytochrome-b5 reductase